MDRRNKEPISIKDRWDIGKDIALILASIATPWIVADIGGKYNANIKDSENRVRYVELAIAQLRASPTPETGALREWAVELLDSQSPIPLPAAAKAQLKTNSLSALVGSATGVSIGSGSLTVRTEKPSASER